MILCSCGKATVVLDNQTIAKVENIQIGLATIRETVQPNTRSSPVVCDMPGEYTATFYAYFGSRYGWTKWTSVKTLDVKAGGFLCSNNENVFTITMQDYFVWVDMDGNQVIAKVSEFSQNITKSTFK